MCAAFNHPGMQFKQPPTRFQNGASSGMFEKWGRRFRLPNSNPRSERFGNALEFEQPILLTIDRAHEMRNFIWQLPLALMNLPAHFKNPESREVLTILY